MMAETKFQKYEAEREARKTMVKKSLELAGAADAMVSEMENVGIKLDFDDDTTVVGRMVNLLFTNPHDIVCLALHMTLKHEMGFYENERAKLKIPVHIDSFYPESGNAVFSITAEGMYDLVNKVAADFVNNKEDGFEMMWNCFVDNKEEAKTWLETTYKIIGFTKT